MSRIKLPTSVWLPPAIIGAILVSACSVNVQKESDGEQKQVDIKTPVGGIHVSKQANPADVGVAIYPGARLKPGDSPDVSKSANVDISGFGYGLKVIALQYESDDPPAKLITFYKDQLKKYGNVLECHTSKHLDMDTTYSDKPDSDKDQSSNKGSHAVACGGDGGSNIELKVGTNQNQHIVAVEPEGKGSTFSLVYVRTHGKDAEI